MSSTKNPWQHARVDPTTLEGNKYLNPSAPAPEPEPDLPEPARSDLQGQYILMPRANTYAKGVDALRKACQADSHSPHPLFTRSSGASLYRQLTFREVVKAKVEDYESYDRTDDERKRLWNTWIYSCSGIATAKGTTKFKFVRESEDLIAINPTFRDGFLPVSYNSISGVELDSSKRGMIYNDYIPYDKIEDHEGWRAALEDDIDLLKALRDITWHERGKPDTLMGFYVRQNTSEDELRALFVGYLDGDSFAYGNNYLNDSGSFLRVAQLKTP